MNPVQILNDPIGQEPIGLLMTYIISEWDLNKVSLKKRKFLVSRELIDSVMKVPNFQLLNKGKKLGIIFGPNYPNTRIGTPIYII